MRKTALVIPAPWRIPRYVQVPMLVDVKMLSVIVGSFYFFLNSFPSYILCANAGCAAARGALPRGLWTRSEEVNDRHLRREMFHLFEALKKHH